MMIAGSLFFEDVEWIVKHRPFPFVLMFALAGLLHLFVSVAKRPSTLGHAE